ncbi:MAG: transcription elongation factor GreA [Planctomycetota bacterium]
MSQFNDRLKRAIKAQTWDEYEEAWLDAIESENTKFSDYIRAANEAITAGHGERAGQMLELIHQSGLIDSLSPEKNVEFLETLACSLPRSKPTRTLLLKTYKEQFGHIEGFDGCVETSGLMDGTRPGEVIPLFKRMIHYQPGSYVKHRSGWGVGMVKELDPSLGTATVDFEKKDGHSVKLDALPQICDPIESDHYQVLAWKKPDELRRIAEEEPIELVKLVLRTSNRPLPLSRIREAISGVAVDSTSWSRWWARTRNAIKKDALIGQSGGKSNELYLLDGPEALTTSLDRKFEGLSPIERLKALRESVTELRTDQHHLLEEHYVTLRRDIDRGDLSISDRVSALLLLKANAPDGQEIAEVGALALKVSHPAHLLNSLHRDDDLRDTMDVIRELDPVEWKSTLDDFLMLADDSLREYLVQEITDNQGLDHLNGLASKVMRRPNKSPLMFLYLARIAASANHGKFSILAGVSPADLFRQALALFDRLSLKSEGNRKDPSLATAVKRYKQHLATKPFALLNRILDQGTIADAREIYIQLTGSRSLSDSNVDKVKAIILRKFPKALAGQRFRTSVSASDSAIYSTQMGMDKVRSEVEQIRNVKLPEIFEAIGDAAALGDLSENAEFTSAIEERENLNRRVLELQGELDRARLIDPTQTSTTQVGLGCKIRIMNLTTDSEHTYSLLGPWDGGPEEGVLSYLSPLGKALLQGSVGEEIEVELPNGTQTVKIEEISRGNTPTAKK